MWKRWPLRWMLRCTATGGLEPSTFLRAPLLSTGGPPPIPGAPSLRLPIRRTRCPETCAHPPIADPAALLFAEGAQLPWGDLAWRAGAPTADLPCNYRG